MTKYHALAVCTGYWRPGADYLSEIADALDGKIQNGDFVVVSEKAVSTATGRIVDEENVVPTVAAKFLAGFWMRLVWGYPLGILCGFGPRLLGRLRNYPFESGADTSSLRWSRLGFCRRSCSALKEASTAPTCRTRM